MNLLKGIFDAVFSRECAVCASVLKKEESFVCGQCLSDVKIIRPPFCKKCGRPFISEETLKYSPDHLCAGCRGKRLSFHSVRAVGVYDGALRKLIHHYKFNGQRFLGEFLSGIMLENIREKFDSIDFDAVMSVPLHKKRLREREFDQSLLLSLNIGKNLDIPVITDNLIRNRYTRPQLELKKKERFQNVKQAFTVKRKEEIKGKQILLIDDVLTTGATIHECARVLKKKGAKSVDVLVLSMIC